MFIFISAFISHTEMNFGMWDNFVTVKLLFSALNIIVFVPKFLFRYVTGLFICFQVHITRVVQLVYHTNHYK